MAGRSSSWDGDVGDVANIMNDHIKTFSEVVYAASPDFRLLAATALLRLPQVSGQ